jgi:hypothetical protein
MEDRFADRQWHKSTRSADSDCVEVAVDGSEIWVRDSHMLKPELVFTAAAWSSFLNQVKDGVL